MSGAINELDSDVNTINENITALETNKVPYEENGDIASNGDFIARAINDPLGAEPPISFIENDLRIADLESNVGKYFNTLFSNADTSSATVITSYPTKAGFYRISNTYVVGTPASASNYGTLMIFNCGGYYTHYFISTTGELYTAFVSMLSTGNFVPTSWKKFTSTSDGVKV